MSVFLLEASMMLEMRNAFLELRRKDVLAEPVTSICSQMRYGGGAVLVLDEALARETLLPALERSGYHAVYLEDTHHLAFMTRRRWFSYARSDDEFLKDIQREQTLLRTELGIHGEVELPEPCTLSMLEVLLAEQILACTSGDQTPCCAVPEAVWSREAGSSLQLRGWCAPRTRLGFQLGGVSWIRLDLARLLTTSTAFPPQP